MKVYEKTNRKTVEDVYSFANNNAATKKRGSEDFTFILQDLGAVCMFMLRENTFFKNKLLKSCYYLSITFLGVDANGNNAILSFNTKKAKKILKTFFPESLKLLWEHAPFTTKGVAAFTHHFYLVVSIPYGRKAIILQPEDMKELINNNYVLYSK